MAAAALRVFVEDPSSGRVAAVDAPPGVTLRGLTELACAALGALSGELRFGGARVDPSSDAPAADLGISMEAHVTFCPAAVTLEEMLAKIEQLLTEQLLTERRRLADARAAEADVAAAAAQLRGVAEDARRCARAPPPGVVAPRALCERMRLHFA